MATGICLAVSLILMICVYFSALQPESEYKGEIKSNKQGFILPVLLGLAVRIFAAAMTDGYQTDMSCWRGWSELLIQNGPWGFYREDVFCDYSPGYLYVLWLLGGIRHLMPAVNTTAEIILLKLPAIVCDLITGVVVYKLAKEQAGSEKASQALCLLYILSPAVIVNSAVWGQVDSVFTLVAVLALYYLYKEKYVKSAVLIGIAVLVKPQALMLGPVFVFAFAEKIIKDRRYVKTFLVSTLCFAAAVIVPALPFIITKDAGFLLKLYGGTMSSYPYATLNAANLAGAFGANFADQTQKFFIVSYQVFGILAIIAAIILCGALFFKSKDKSKIFYCAAMLITVIFTLGVRMHERYLFPVILFFLAAYIFKRDKRILGVAGGISLLHFANVALAYASSKTQSVHIRADNGIFILISVLTVAATAYAVFAGFKIYTDIKAEKREIYMKADEKKITKKDIIIILAVTFIYAVVAFVNLGDAVAPVTRPDFTQQKVAVAAFDEVRFIEKVSYFKGLGDTQIKILTSIDGVNWEDNTTFESGDCFKWEQAEVLENARYVAVTVADEKAELFEMAFYNQIGDRMELTSVSELFDEQELAAPFATFKNGTYFDEIYHARTAYEHLNMVGSHYENTHPPLGKHIIGIGISMFGMNPFGWRFMGTLFGVLMLPLIYIFAKRMFKNSLLATATMLLLTFDFMHFAQTRIATIDSYAVFFIILMYYFMYIFYDEAETLSMKKTLVLLLCSGVAMGLGMASKWIDIYAGAGLAVLFAVTMVRLYKHQREGFFKKLVTIGVWCMLVFVLIPFGIYYASYIPIHIADGSTNWWGDFWNYQGHMLSYHGTLVDEHAFSSKWYEWPIMKRPIWFYNCDGLPEGRISSISSFGNPLVWWGGTLAVIYLLITKFKTKDRRLSFIFISFAAQYLPWIFIGRIVFIYHFFASVPFIIFALVYVMKDICQRYSWGKRAVYVYLGAALLLFIVFYPVLSGVEVSHAYGEALEWFNTWVFCN